MSDKSSFICFVLNDYLTNLLIHNPLKTVIVCINSVVDLVEDSNTKQKIRISSMNSEEYTLTNLIYLIYNRINWCYEILLCH